MLELGEETKTTKDIFEYLKNLVDYDVVGKEEEIQSQTVMEQKDSIEHNQKVLAWYQSSFEKNIQLSVVCFMFLNQYTEKIGKLIIKINDVKKINRYHQEKDLLKMA